MGVFGDGDNSKKGKGRGKTNVASRLAGLGQESQHRGDADWRVVSWTWASGIVIETTRRGGMVSFGTSRDKGAYKLSVFLDGERRDIWISSSEDVDAELEKICHFLAALPD